MNRTLAIGAVVAATVALSGCSLLRGSDRDAGARANATGPVSATTTGADRGG